MMSSKMMRGRTIRMNKYVGKICPYCKGVFTEEDEIVVCSDCEMPHHKECWISNKGCTTFGCSGTIQGIDIQVDYGISSAPKYEQRNDGISVDPSAPVYCVKCGNQIVAGSDFCGKCGTPVSASYNSTNTFGAISSFASKVSSEFKEVMKNYDTSDVLDQEMPEYIGTKVEYYMAQFGQLKMSKKYNSWNWAAFLLSPFWCLYRKMFVQGGVILAISFLLAVIGGPFSLVISFGMWAVVGVFANYFYMYDLEKRIAKGKYLTGPEKYNYVQKYGDVNATVPSVAAVVYVLLCVILFA